MNRKTMLAAAMTGPLLVIAPPAWAQAADGWRYQAALNVYLPDIGGRTTLPDTGTGSDATIDAETILENLKMTFMGTFEASRGGWGVFTDVLYMDIGDTRSQFRDISIGGVGLPAGAEARASYDLKGWVWTLGGVWKLSSDPASTFDVVAGARLLDIEQTLDWTVTGNVGTIPVPGRAGYSKVGLSNWDAIVGVKGRMAFGAGRQWFVPFYLDVGTGESDLTWQAVGGVGYSFGWGDVVASWRVIDYEMKSGKSVENLNFNGPSISAVFRW